MSFYLNIPKMLTYNAFREIYLITMRIRPFYLQLSSIHALLLASLHVLGKFSLVKHSIYQIWSNFSRAVVSTVL